MAWLVPGMATMAARVTALLVMVSLAPALATMAAPLLLALLLPALVLAGTRAQRLEQLKTRLRVEASGLVHGRQLPRLRAAVAVAEA